MRRWLADVDCEIGCATAQERRNHHHGRTHLRTLRPRPRSRAYRRTRLVAGSHPHRIPSQVVSPSCRRSQGHDTSAVRAATTTMLNRQAGQRNQRLPACPCNEIKFAFVSGISRRSCASLKLLPFSSPEEQQNTLPALGFRRKLFSRYPGLPGPQSPRGSIFSAVPFA